MTQTEMTKKQSYTINNSLKEIDTIERWFKYEYPRRLQAISRYAYLGLPIPESRYSLELEAYDKENRLRELYGEPPLPKLKNNDIFGGNE